MKPGGAFEVSLFLCETHLLTTQMIEEDFFFPGKLINNNNNYDAKLKAPIYTETTRPMPQIDKQQALKSFPITGVLLQKSLLIPSEQHINS